MDSWPFWMMEQYIKIVNEISEEEDKHRKKEEESQHKNMPNFNPSSYMNNMNSMMNKFK